MNVKCTALKSVVDRHDGIVIRSNIDNSFRLKKRSKLFILGNPFARSIEDNLVILVFELATFKFEFSYLEFPSDNIAILDRYAPDLIYEEEMWAFSVIENPGSFSTNIEKSNLISNRGIVDLQFGFHPVSVDISNQRRRQMLKIWEHIKNRDCIVLTFGTNDRWIDSSTGFSIADAPLQPMIAREHWGRFSFTTLSFSDTFNYVKETIDLITSISPKNKFHFTMAPVPIRKNFCFQDILNANEACKEKLRSICDEIIDQYFEVDYLPSYEMISICSSDVSFRKELLHLRQEAVSKIVSLLRESYFSDVGDIRIHLEQSFRELSTELNNTDSMERVLSHLPIGALSAKDALLCCRIAWRCKKRYIAKELLIFFFEVVTPNA